jgi:hypothetical protein
MIKVSVMYPNQQGARSDMSYHCTKHIPMVRQLLGPALMNVAVAMARVNSTARASKCHWYGRTSQDHPRTSPSPRV